MQHFWCAFATYSTVWDAASSSQRIIWKKQKNLNFFVYNLKIKFTNRVFSGSIIFYQECCPSQALYCFLEVNHESLWAVLLLLSLFLLLMLLLCLILSFFQLFFLQEVESKIFLEDQKNPLYFLLRNLFCTCRTLCRFTGSFGDSISLFVSFIALQLDLPLLSLKLN